jgi:hypothetical protein
VVSVSRVLRVCRQHEIAVCDYSGFVH